MFPRLMVGLLRFVSLVQYGQSSKKCNEMFNDTLHMWYPLHTAPTIADNTPDTSSAHVGTGFLKTSTTDDIGLEWRI